MSAGNMRSFSARPWFPAGIVAFVAGLVAGGTLVMVAAAAGRSSRPPIPVPPWETQRFRYERFISAEVPRAENPPRQERSEPAQSGLAEDWRRLLQDSRDPNVLQSLVTLLAGADFLNENGGRSHAVTEEAEGQVVYLNQVAPFFRSFTRQFRVQALG